MPFRVPKMYFADHCTQSSNFVLITERVPFDRDGYERAHDKYLDHLLPRPAHEYYFMLVKQLGRMHATYKTGGLGDRLEDYFPTQGAFMPETHMGMTKGKVSYLEVSRTFVF